MGEVELSKRLLTASKYTVENKTVVDIGSDHAYLPIYLIQKNRVQHAIAGEVAQGPYHNAMKKVEEFNLTDKIDVRFGSGLHILQKKETIGTVFICGMGGTLIKDILSEGMQADKLLSTARLVLQPNNGEQNLRCFLQENHYHILSEEIVEDNGKIYEIVVAEYSTKKITLSNKELLFGPILLKEKSPIFKQKWLKELDKYQNIMQQLEHSEDKDKKKEILQKIEMIQEVIT